MSSGPKRPATEVLPVAEELVRILSPFCHRIEIAGSLRRQQRQVSDIDLVAIPKIVSEMEPDRGSLFGETKRIEKNLLWIELDKLVGAGQGYLKHGPKARSFIAPHESIQVELCTCEEGNWGLRQLLSTGSAEFNRYVVTQLGRNQRPSFDGWVRLAADDGRRIWEDEEKREMPKLPTPKEEAVFDYARIQYRDPYQRH